MYKLLVALPFLFAAVNAGYLGSPIAYSAPAVVAHSAPLYAPAPIIKTAVPIATSYQNIHKISTSPVVVKHIAPAPIAYAAPIVKAYPAPIIKAAPIAYSAPIYKAPLAYPAPIAYSAPIVKAPLAYAAAPALIKSPYYAHGYGFH